MEYNLTEKEKEVLAKYLKDEYSPFLAEEDEIEAMNSLIKKAEDLMRAENAVDEIGDDLIRWFHNRIYPESV